MQFDIFGINQRLDETESQNIKKRELRNLLTSYADESDVFAELLQNAIDAILIAKREMQVDISSFSLKVFIGRRSNDAHYFAVTDNGIGMPPSIAQKFAMPGYSALKKIGQSIGYKGVGASFYFASANRISFRTVDRSGQKTEATVSGARNWIENETSPPPFVTNNFDAPNPVVSLSPEKRGTSVVYYFDANSKPQNLSNIVIKDDNKNTEIERWAFYLCSKTALGQTTSGSLDGLSVEFLLDTGDGDPVSSTWTLDRWSSTERKLGYPYPGQVIRVAKPRREIDETPDSQKTKHNRKYQAIHDKLDYTQILDLEIDFSQEERQLVEDYLDFVDIFFAYSTDVLKEVKTRSGCRSAPIRYGIRLSVDGAPQGRVIDFDLTSNQGLGRQAHAVFAFKRLELDVGRKIPASEIVNEVIRKIGVRIMTVIGDYRWSLRKKDRPDVTSDIEEWRKHISARERNSISRYIFEQSDIAPPISVDPDSENDVIYLFGSLITARFLKGYRVRALSGSARYDGLIDVSPPDDKLTAHNDPLSIRDQHENISGEAKVIEFKFEFISLLEDFESKRKNPREIDLIVVWRIPSLDVSRGSVDYCYADKEDTRPNYGVTHIWIDDNDSVRIPIISLEHVCAIIGKSIENGKSTTAYATPYFDKLKADDRDRSV